jgi:sugar (pentulose or hexulose) kinase
MDLLLGIDVGTTACKAAVVTTDGHEVAHAQRPTPWRPVPTGAEIHARELAEVAAETAVAAVSAGPSGTVLGVGVCSIGETGVMLDDRGEPLAPGIAWHDTRGGAEAARMATDLGAETFVRRCGLPVAASWTAPKLEALRREHPELARGRRWLSVAEWVVAWLGGDEVAEPSLASRTGLLDVTEGAWWPEALERLGLRPEVMPPLLPAGGDAGRVHGVTALEGAVLTVGGHDHPCATVGAGATHPGDVLDSCGTAEAIVATRSAPVAPDAIASAVARGVTVGRHVVPDRMALLGFFKAGLALRRFLDLLGVEAMGPARDALDREAREADIGPLEVEGIAEDLHAVRGIGRNTSPGALWRAAQVAAAHETARILDDVASIAGPRERLVVAGGWTRSDVYRRIKRDVIGGFDVPVVTEAGARGAALFAGVAAGVLERGNLPAPPTSTSDA